MAPQPRVLIIEDDLSTINLLSQIVKRAGYEPVPARGGWEGLHLLREQGADLILLDLMMKGMDGWSLLDTIKADHQLGALPVIIVSARHPAEDPRGMEAHAGQFEQYFVKPFAVDELVAEMARALQKAAGGSSGAADPGVQAEG